MAKHVSLLRNAEADLTVKEEGGETEDGET
jgi:hypothetical protein